MSGAKRSHSRRQPDARPVPQTSDTSIPPSSKRLKSSHVPTPKSDGLKFLVDDDARQGRKLEAKLTNGVLDKRSARVDESSAVVAPSEVVEAVNGHREVIDISSADDESSDEEDEDAVDEEGGVGLVNGHADLEQVIAGAEDVEMEDEAEAEAEPEEPSFGDMLHARHPETIDVQAAYAQAAPDMQVALPTPTSHAMTVHTGTSLSTVLTQALRTNDKDLLETCFAVIDQQTIRATIQRLQSHLVGNLMQRLAERIHKRPGRTGHLMTWIQWSLVAHGGYLVTQPQIMKQLKALNQVLRERANGLQSLLQLKGKLDMLGAQLELRRSTLAASAGLKDDEDNDEGVLYIEGRDQDDDGMDSDPTAEADVVRSKHSKTSKKALMAESGAPAEYHTDSDESDEGSDMPNGVIQEGAESEDEEVDNEEEQGVLDLEADESDDGEDSAEDKEDDTDASSANDIIDDDEEEDDSEGDEIVVQAPKMSKLERKR
ncbi:Small subunit (SSU) processome component [Oleoguttula sp. CCFEE 5521]